MKLVNLLIYEPYPMGQGGGNLRTLWYILKYLDLSKFKPVIVAPEDADFLNRFREKGVEVLIEKPPPSIQRFAGQVLRDNVFGRTLSAIDLVRYNLQLARLMRKRRVDVIYCNSIRAVLLAGIGARVARVPVLWYVKGALENRFLDRLGFFLADRIIFFCEANRDDRYPWLVKWMRSKIHIVRIGIDAGVIEHAKLSDKRDLKDKLDIRPDRINAIILGQIYPPKGQHFVLQVLREIVRENPSFMLYIVGDHVLDEYAFYRAELDRIIDQQGMQEHVRFTGWRTDALELLDTMDIMIHPSLAEGFGRAVLEGMAMGLAVVASAVGGLREIIRDGENGFLVEPGDSAAIADRVCRLARDAALRRAFGEGAKSEVSAHYMIEDKVRQLECIWEGMARA
jgi:glycosyltransferase involved in cell wall biosynthesis